MANRHVVDDPDELKNGPDAIPIAIPC